MKIYVYKRKRDPLKRSLEKPSIYCVNENASIKCDEERKTTFVTTIPLKKTICKCHL